MIEMIEVEKAVIRVDIFFNLLIDKDASYEQ